MERPWLRVAMGFGAGGAVGQAAPVAAWALPLAALLVLALRRGRGVLLAAGAAGAMAAGSQVVESPPGAPFEAEVASVTARGDRWQIVARPDRAPDAGVEVWLEARPKGLAPGARVRVVRAARPLREALGPGDYDPAARGQRRDVVGRARGPLILTRSAGAWAEALVATRSAARAQLAALDRRVGAGLLTGLLLGDRAAVPVVARRALEDTGTGHLLAVSGLHVGGLAWVVALLVTGLARRAGAVDPGRWGAAAALPAALAYVALAQFPLSACRAGLMVGLVVVGRLLGRPSDTLDLLGLAALAVMAAVPGAAAEPGFQLSFGAVAALLSLAPKARGLRAAVLAAVVASAATAPIQAWHFGTVAPAAPLANVLLTPIAATVLVPLGALGMAVATWTPALLQAAAWGAEVLVALAEALAALTGGARVVGAHSAPLLALPLVGLVAVATGRRRPAVVAALVAVGATLALRPPTHALDVVPVGQGDAILVRGGGATLLVDAGPDVEARRLGAHLRHLGVGRLDHVVISHLHPDHTAGLAALLEALPVGAVWWNGRRSPSPPWRAARAVGARRGVPFRVGEPAGRLGALRWQTRLAAPPAALAENDASLVVRVDGPGASVLLTGDLESAGEARLLAAGPRPVSLLKAPHHGSRTSSGPALLDALCPRGVVFNVGRDNRYGFPHPDVVRRYRRRGVTGWRTDRDGLIRLVFDDAATVRAARRGTRTLAPPRCAGDEGVP